MPDVTGERGHTSEEVAEAIMDASTGTSTIKLGRRLGMGRDSVAAILRNPVYSTGIYRIRRKDGVTIQHGTTPLVDPDVQERDSRPGGETNR